MWDPLLNLCQTRLARSSPTGSIHLSVPPRNDVRRHRAPANFTVHRLDVQQHLRHHTVLAASGIALPSLRSGLAFSCEYYPSTSFGDYRY